MAKLIGGRMSVEVKMRERPKKSHVLLLAECQCDIVPHDWKMNLVVPIWNGNEDERTCNCNIYKGFKEF